MMFIQEMCWTLVPDDCPSCGMMVWLPSRTHLGSCFLPAASVFQQ